jgi:transcriptional regulator with XRE-family HTH domain
MDASTPTGKLLLALKEQFKARRLNYRDVGARLQVSEATVKRYFSGKGVTVEVLQRMAEIVGLDLFSLVILAQEVSAIQHGLNSAQLAALKKRGPLRALFFMMSAGWTATQIAREFDLGQQIDGYLAKMESLGLIRRLAKRGVKILVKPSLIERAYGEMSDLAVEAAEQFLRDLNLRDQECDFHFNPLRFSGASILELRKIMQHFESEVRELSRRDLGLPPEETQWYQLFLAAQPVTRKKLLHWR